MSTPIISPILSEYSLHFHALEHGGHQPKPEPGHDPIVNDLDLRKFIIDGIILEQECHCDILE